jgi:hypothetical protein
MEPTRTSPGPEGRPPRRRAHPARRARRWTGLGSALALVGMTGGMVAGRWTGTTAAASGTTNVQAVGTASEATTSTTSTTQPAAPVARAARAAVPTRSVTTTHGS